MHFFTSKKSIELDVEDVETGYFLVTSVGDFSLDDISFISTDESVASFAYDKTVLDNHIYYKITALKPGTTIIYAQTKSGSVKTDEITITVKQPPTTTTTTTKATTTKKTTTAAPKTTTKENTTTQNNAAANVNKTTKKTTVAAVDNQSGTVYWVPKGEVWHSTKNCPTLHDSDVIYSGTVAEAKAAGKNRHCKKC